MKTPFAETGPNVMRGSSSYLPSNQRLYAAVVFSTSPDGCFWPYPTPNMTSQNVGFFSFADGTTTNLTVPFLFDSPIILNPSLVTVPSEMAPRGGTSSKV